MLKSFCMSAAMTAALITLAVVALLLLLGSATLDIINWRRNE